jgi:hypothetical protein
LDARGFELHKRVTSPRPPHENRVKENIQEKLKVKNHKLDEKHHHHRAPWYQVTQQPKSNKSQQQHLTKEQKEIKSIQETKTMPKHERN